MRNQGARGRGRRGRNDRHQRADEFHDLAAHAQRVDAAHHGQQGYGAGHERSKEAMKYSSKAYQYSQEAHQKSGSVVGEAGKTARAQSTKRGKGLRKGSKKR